MLVWLQLAVEAGVKNTRCQQYCNSSSGVASNPHAQLQEEV